MRSADSLSRRSLYAGLIISPVGSVMEGVMSTLMSGALRNHQEDPVAPFSRLDRAADLVAGPRAPALTRPKRMPGKGFAAAEIQQQTGTLHPCRLRRVTEYIQQNLDKD